MMRSSKRPTWRVPAAILLVLVCASFVAPAVVQAQTPSTPSSPPPAPSADSGIASAASSVICAALTMGGSCDVLYWVVGNAQGVLSWILYIVIWLFMTVVGGPLLALEGWFLEFIIVLNTQIVNSPIVRYGFSVSLAFANLGFVLAIIIIAIMTILRVQSYGAKSLLFKVVVAAIAVNFSLVIAGTLMNFSDSLSLYLVRQATPDCGSDDSRAVFEAQGCITKFSNAIAGAAQPQRAFVTTRFQTENEKAGARGSSESLQAAAGAAGAFAASLVGIWIAAALLLASAIVLGGATLMFLLRYLWIAILLVLMPFAWLLWIFPSTKSLFSKWWNRFLKWTFMGPLLLFFLYLAIQTSSAISQWGGDGGVGSFGSNDSGFALPGKSGAIGYFSKIGGNFLAGQVQQILPGILVLGTMAAGLFAANSIGISLAGKTMDSLKSVGKSVGSWTAQRARRNVGDRIRTSGQQTKGGETTNRFQRIGGWITSNLGFLPGGTEGGARVAAFGKPNKERLEKEAKAYKESLADLPKAAFTEALLRGSSDPTKLLGLMQAAAEKPGGYLGKLIASATKDPSSNDPKKYAQEKMAQEQGRAFNKKLKEEYAPALERFGKFDEVAGNAPVMGAFKTQGQVMTVQKGADGKIKEVMEDIEPTDAKKKAQLVAGSLAKVKEGEKIDATLVAKLDPKTRVPLELKEEDEESIQAVIGALSLNNGTIREISDKNTETMAALVDTLSKVKDIVETKSGQNLADLKADKIQEHLFGFGIRRNQAARLQTMINYINTNTNINGEIDVAKKKKEEPPPAPSWQTPI